MYGQVSPPKNSNQICHDYIVGELNCIPPLSIMAAVATNAFPEVHLYQREPCGLSHGIPSPSKKLKNGDAINIDITVIKDGYHGDTSKMFFAGEASVIAKRLSKITQECMYKGIEQVRPGARLGDANYAIQRHAEDIVSASSENFASHGIAKVFHDDPQVLHYGRPGTGGDSRRRHVFHH